MRWVQTKTSHFDDCVDVWLCGYDMLVYKYNAPIMYVAIGNEVQTNNYSCLMHSDNVHNIFIFILFICVVQMGKSVCRIFFNSSLLLRLQMSLLIDLIGFDYNK